MLKWFICGVWALLLAPLSASGYSVLTHQANIDSTWKRCLEPLLQQRYPGASEEQLLEAKSFAYGGSIIQDMGFYPFGSKLFTNLTHYVRSGDFVRHLLDDAQGRNEYAFALGALAHYAADLSGHPEGTNKAMPLVYPELARKFGKIITYVEAPSQHTQLEFAFDVVQVAAGRYRTSDYQRYVGFQVSKRVLETAFKKTYGLELGEVIFNVDLSISSFRFAVRQLIPVASRAAWQSQKKEIRKLSPLARRREYVYTESERKFRKQYGTAYEHPGTGARILAYFVRVLPKIGPLAPFAFRPPTPEAQEVFKASFRQVIKNYCTLVEQEPKDTLSAGRPLVNADFDTGHQTKAGEYALADETYGEWVRQLAKSKFDGISNRQKDNILTFFGTVPKEPKDEDEKEKDNRRETQEALQLLRTTEAK